MGELSGQTVIRRSGLNCITIAHVNKNELVITTSEAETRLDKWLAAAERLVSRKRAFTALERGQIFVNDAEQSAADAGRRLQSGDKVRLWLDRPGSASRRSYVSQNATSTGKRRGALHILYEDQSLIVLNKPAGLLTVPLPRQPDEESLQALVEGHLKVQPKSKTLVVHRIDRDTSGLVVFAKDFNAQQKLKDQFAGRLPERIYQAFVYGLPTPDEGEWRDNLVWDQEELQQRQPQAQDSHTHEAISRYRVVERYAATALLEVALVTGKRNQIRVQAAQRGHQLIGERQYTSVPSPRPLIECPRQALHAGRLVLLHPLDERRMKFEAPLPEDLQALQVRLKAATS